MTTPPPGIDGYANQQSDQQPGQQPAAQYPVPPVPAPSKKKGFGGKLAIRLGVLVLIAGGVVVYNYASGNPSTASVGDCVHNKGTDSSPDVSIVDCKDATADYKVLKTLSSTNTDDCNNVPGTVAAYTQSGGNEGDTLLCLGKNSH
ncbi:hypothetical protein [Streptacidiphilus sp. EB129]|jgi:hypothetical protein|uniref:LppU/SCO3897 family protein n=1 Tax=Streptacidiphilus sp. EB129 TaxID=3156262 RepID=UPI0035139602